MGKLVQFAVHRNTQRLEDPFGGVSAFAAGGGRYRRVDELDELAGMGKGLFFPLCGNSLGNGIGKAFFAKFPKDAGHSVHIIGV